MSRKSAISFLIAAIIPVLAFGQAAQSQSEMLVPQLLYRSGENLVMVDADSGEETVLPGVNVTASNGVVLSPAGHYLAVLQALEGQPISSCLNVYSIDERKFIYDEPIHCKVEAVGFSSDDTLLAFSTRTSGAQQPVLSLHSFATGATRAIFEYADGESIYEDGIHITDIRWSPTGQYVSFVTGRDIMGGSLNHLHILNAETLAEYTVNGPLDDFYASYDPLWSSDDEWILLKLQEEYAAGGAVPITNHRGDLYLIRSETGALHRLTFTPGEAETSVGWTADGQITYVIPQTVVLSVDDAASIQPPDAIIEPPEIDGWTEGGCFGTLVSSDPNYLAQICSALKGSDREARQVVIRVYGGTNYRVTLPKEEYYLNVLIGWRMPNE